VLIDVWGRPHSLDECMTIGRTADGPGIAILDPAISRHHARIGFAGGVWTVEDLGSANGTYLEDRPIEGVETLHEAVCVRFGPIAFYFLQHGAQLEVPRATDIATTLIPRIPRALADGSGLFAVEAAAAAAAAAAPAASTDDDCTYDGLPTISLKLHEPTGGGGGVLELDGKQVQLTATQLELMSLMIRRMTADADRSPLVRGFVRSSELIASLSWDTRDPGENHVKQLVRRLRRALMKVSSGDLIESRHRFGYRLRAIPRIE
jgi:pSer/pThr/pTyr-binding forkhead associated (FHA) protein